MAALVEPAAAGHRCSRFVKAEDAGPWVMSGPWRERKVRLCQRCAECGAVRPQRVPRWKRLEREAAQPSSGPLSAEARKVAGLLLARPAGIARPSGMKALGDRAGLSGARLGQCLEELAMRGALTLWVAPKEGSADYVGALPLSLELLEELAQPGRRAMVEAIRRQELALLEEVSHPVALEVARLLREDAQVHSNAERMKALGAIARFVESGESLPERVFSTRYLGDSKALSRVRGSVERLLGPLEQLGLREHGALTLVGGRGALELDDGSILEMERFGPMLGLSRERLERLARTRGAESLWVVENQTVFEACARGEVPEARGALVVCSLGFPGRGVRRIVERHPGSVVVWADLDLAGARIARLILQWASGRGRTHRMTPADFLACPRTRPLTARAETALLRELELRPEEPLADLLRALLQRRAWAEQEGQL